MYNDTLVYTVVRILISVSDQLVFYNNNTALNITFSEEENIFIHVTTYPAA